jgi:hypothetical protein
MNAGDVTVPPCEASSRREFLHQAAGLATGVAALGPGAVAADQVVPAPNLLPTVKLGSHQITRAC